MAGPTPAHRLVAALLAFAVAAGASAATPLLDAVKAGNREAVAELLRGGADVNAAEPDGTTPLMWAAYGGHAELVAALLDAGADPEVVNAYGATAMAEAAIAGDAARPASTPTPQTPRARRR
jgi:ankyrin repeat protein